MTIANLTILELQLHQIHVPPEQQIRASIDQTALRELANSMAEIGQLQPITVCAENTGYALLAGARRLAAASLNKWPTIRAILSTADQHTRQIVTLAENIIRTDLTAVEEAHALAANLETKDPDVDHLAKRLGKSRAWIDSRLEILQWPPALQAAVHAARISPAAAKHLAKIPEAHHRDELIEQAAAAGISARTAAMWYQQAAAENSTPDLITQAGSNITTTQPNYVTTARCFFCGQQHPINETTRVVSCSPCFQQIAKAQEIAKATDDGIEHVPA